MDEKNASHVNVYYLKYQKPFDFKSILAFMRPRAVKGVEVVGNESYARTFKAGGAGGFFVVKDCPDKSSLELKIGCDDENCHGEIRDRVRKMFDLDTDFGPINKKFLKDRILSKGIVGGHVPGLPAAFNPFEFTVRAILGQQITVKAATTLAARIARQAGLKSTHGFPADLDNFFPEPTDIVEMELDGLGIIRSRQETIKTVAQSIIDRRVLLSTQQTFEEFHKSFIALKGIGDWTVNYVAMRGLGMVDCFPAADLGIIKALARNGKAPSKKQILETAERWRPYRSYAAMCLWSQGKE